MSTILWVDEHPFSWLFGCSPNVAGKVEVVICSAKLQTCGLPHEDVALWGLQGFQLLKKSKPEVNNLFYHFSWNKLGDLRHGEFTALRSFSPDGEVVNQRIWMKYIWGYNMI